MMFSSSNCCCYGRAAAVRAGSSTLQLCKLSPKLKCPPYLQRHMIKPRYVFPRPFQVKPVSPSASLEDSSCHKARPARGGWRWGTDPASGWCQYQSSSTPDVLGFSSATNKYPNSTARSKLEEKDT